MPTPRNHHLFVCIYFHITRRLIFERFHQVPTSANHQLFACTYFRVNFLLSLSYKTTTKLTCANFHQAPMRTLPEKFLKSQLATQITRSNHERADFWECSSSAHAPHSQIVKSQLSTGWRRGIECLKLQVNSRKPATNYRAFLREMTGHAVVRAQDKLCVFATLYLTP